MITHHFPRKPGSSCTNAHQHQLFARLKLIQAQATDYRLQATTTRWLSALQAGGGALHIVVVLVVVIVSHIKDFSSPS